MLSFAFLPQIAGVVNRGLVSVGFHPAGELLILAVVIACYTKMWDGAAPLEPLFLECVPPHHPLLGDARHAVQSRGDDVLPDPLEDI